MQGKDYTIDCNGYFQSAGSAKRHNVLVSGDIIPHAGDTLLSVRSGTGGHIDLDFGNNIIFSGRQSYDFFEDGLPMRGQYESPIRIIRSEPEIEVYAVYEIYDDLDRQSLISYSAPYNRAYSVKLRCAGLSWQILRFDGGSRLEKVY